MGEVTGEEVTGNADALEDGKVNRGNLASETLNDSDSGLDTTSIGSQKTPQPDGKTEDNVLQSSPIAVKSCDSGVTSDSSTELAKRNKHVRPRVDGRRRRIPKLGLSILQNPDLSFIRRATVHPKCISCKSELRQRQPLVKTNGILFMAEREEQVLRQNSTHYTDIRECAFTRAHIVADWTDDLKDHQDYCLQEIRTSLRYERKFFDKQRKEGKLSNLDTGQKLKEIEEADFDQTSGLPRQNSRRSKTADLSERIKKMKSRVQNSIQKTKNGHGSKYGVHGQEEFLPPPAARPKVRPRPPEEEDHDINFSGKLQSILRLHCENCVLRDKPEEFQSVLFVCQL